MFDGLVARLATTSTSLRPLQPKAGQSTTIILIQMEEYLFLYSLSSVLHGHAEVAAKGSCSPFALLGWAGGVAGGVADGGREAL